MHDTLLRDLVVLVAVSLPVVLAAHRLRIPSVVGFLLAGVAIGPSGLGLIGDPEAVRRLAEIGVVLLLFSVGLELSLTRVMGLGRLVIVGGAIQVIGTMALVTAVFLVLGREGRPALFLGALLALSSTAIALKVYTQRDELETPHGRAVVAISVFQDLAVVPLMLLIPLLGAADASFAAGTRQVALSLAGAAALVVAGRMLVPRALEHVVRTRNRELFTLAIVVIGLGAAWLASLFGLSLALGAFLVGLVVSESEYGAQALSDILPFRDVFSGIFFASVGMLLDLSTVAAAPLATLGFVGIVIVLKAAVAAGAVLAAGRPLQVAVASALGLAQVGEFSFVLAAAGLPLALVSARDYQLFLAASVLSMLVAPFLIAQAGSFAEAVGRWFGYVPLAVHAEQRPHLESLSDHVIVVGYGLNGRNLARALRGAGIPYVILEQNMHAVRRARGEGEPILFGDGTHGEVLERIGIRRARVVVFAIAVAGDERRGVAVARSLNPDVRIVVRTRYVREIEALQALGADEVVPEEFETSLEIFARVLRRYGVPGSEIRREVEAVRRDHYEAFRDRERPYGHLTGRHEVLGVRIGVETCEIDQGAAAIGGHPVSLELRRKTGATLIAVIREGQVLYEPDPDFRFAAHDTVVLVGRPDALEKALPLFRAVEARRPETPPDTRPIPLPADPAIGAEG